MITRRELVARFGSVAGLMFSGVAIGRGRAIDRSLSNGQPPIVSGLSLGVWDTPPAIIFSKFSEGSQRGTSIAWKATYGISRSVIRLVNKPPRFIVEPAMYGGWVALSSDNPPLTEVLNILHQFDLQQRETLAMLAAKPKEQ